MSVERIEGAEPPEEGKKPGEQPPAGEPPFPKDAVKQHGNTTYIDMGQLYGTYIWGFMKYWPLPVHIMQKPLDDYLKTFFTALKNNGTKQMDLSFAQIGDIEKLLKGEPGASDDTITQIFEKNYPVGKTGENFLKYFVGEAHKNGVKVDLSFGGADAAGANMKIPGDPATEADHLAEFMKKYDIDACDFDLEGTGASDLMTENSPEDVVTFFKELHSKLSSQGKFVDLTVEGSLQNGPEGILKPLFADGNYKKMFDGLNLMLYSTTQYYIDANNPSWGISQWIKDAGIPPGEIHIGFYDKIKYDDPNSSAGEKYKIPPGLTNGQAAAYIYQQLEKQLAAIDPSYGKLGEPFFWTDQPQYIPNTMFITDFQNYMSRHPIK